MKIFPLVQAAVAIAVVLAVSGCNGVEPPVPSVSETPIPIPVPTNSVSPSPSVSPTIVSCLNGVILPADVSQIVCDGVPADANDELLTYFKTNSFYAFSTLLDSIRCNWLPYEEGVEGDASGGIVCEATEAFFTLPVPQGCDEDEWNGRRVWVMGESDKGVCSRSDLWGFEEEDITPQDLEYGTSITDYTWACSSEVDGLTCWNIETFHGFQLSESEQLIW